MKFLSFIFAIAFFVQSSVYGVFNVITDGDDVLASPVMQNFRHVNYGNALKPVDSVGNATSNILDIGTNTAYWRDLYLAGTANIGSGLVVDTSTLFVNPVSNRVGIGTTVPGVALAVSGALNIGSAYSAGSGTSNGLVVQGFVGVGTSAPNHPIHLFAGNNSSNDIDGVRLHNNGENGVNINFTNGNGNLGRIAVTKKGGGASSDEGVILFSTATNAVLSEKLRITDDGLVGIGNTNPNNVSLFVGPGSIGTIANSTTTTTRPQIVHSTLSGTAVIGAGVNDGTNNQRAGLFVNNTNSTFGLGSGYSSTNPEFVLLLDSFEAIRVKTGANLGNVGIGTTTAASRLTVSGNASIGSGYVGTVAPTNGAIIQGNVGIGTTSPGRALDVIGSVKGTYFYTGARFNDATSGTMLFQNGSILNGLIREVTGNVWALGHATSEVGGITNDLVWNSSGAVGIGTTAPAQALHVNGNALFNKVGIGTSNVVGTVLRVSGAYGGNPQLIISGASSSQYMSVLFDTESNWGQLNAFGAGAVKPIILNPLGGKVGIEITVSPSATLDVGGTANIQQDLIVRNKLSAPSKEGASAYFGAGSLSVPNSTVTTVNFNSEHYDYGGIHSSGRFTIQSTGRYLICATIQFENTSSSGFRSATLYKNNASFRELDTKPTTATLGSFNCTLSGMHVFEAVTGDVYVVKVAQNSGVTVDVSVLTSFATIDRLN